ncbi:lanosterol 14-alpha-demethylase [Kockovaella imperatae]|uniref:Lanosterol 14-alpha-demethylase n=1 Tax=Kockovaella imperatae TaxID=4999 RepID=A0A1Y1UFU1_9TREE|nr:lanosterol 14-alpha-demethylase [Kockovaella imperatae]ORX36888.1 lanosterol 14-alpha-demethylase [Kockovaella imperatae]
MDVFNNPFVANMMMNTGRGFNRQPTEAQREFARNFREGKIQPIDPTIPLYILSSIAILLFTVVGSNLMQQFLAPRDPSHPPVVLHYFPWFGSAYSYGTDPYKFLFKCRAKYGDVFTFIMFGRKMTVALGPKGNNLSLGGKVSHVSAEDAYTHLTTPVFGKGVVYDCPNEMLMQQKKFIKHGLTPQAFQTYAPLIWQETHQFFEQEKGFNVYPGPKSYEAIKFFSELIILTASRTLQGKEVRAGLTSSAAKHFEHLDKGFTPINFLFPNLPLPSYRKRDKAQKAMSDFYLEIMRKRREGESDVDEHDMIAALTGNEYKDGTPLTDRDVAHMMIAILMAGQHTSSATSSWTLLHLAQKPLIFKALFEEHRDLFQNEDGTWEDVTYESTKEMPLMAAVIRETLRMHAPIHSIYRKVLQDLEVPPALAAGGNGSRPYVVPKGHFVVAAPGVSAMDPKVWPDADKWDPFRWLEDKGMAQEALDSYSGATSEQIDYGFGQVSKGTESPYMPFGAGRHRCVGEQFAYLQLSVIMSYIVRNYDIQLLGAFPQTNYNTMIVLPLNGYVTFKKRGQSKWILSTK